AVREWKSGRPGRAICANAAAVGHLRVAWPAAFRPAEIHRLGEQGRAAGQHHRPAAYDPGSLADETLSGGPPAARPRAWRGGPDRRARACRNGRRAHQRQRNGVDDLSAAGRRIGNDDPSHQRIGLRAYRKSTLRDWLEEDWSRAGLAVEEFLRFV